MLTRGEHFLINWLFSFEFTLFFNFFFHLFLLKGNCFTEFCWFLSNLSHGETYWLLALLVVCQSQLQKLALHITPSALLGMGLSVRVAAEVLCRLHI